MEIFNKSIVSNILYQKFINASNINIDIIKCYYLLFKKEYIIYNIGSYILLFIILIFVVGALIFCFKGYYFLNRKINHVIIITNLDKKSTKSFTNNNLITSSSTVKNRNKNNKNKKKNNQNPPSKKIYNRKHKKSKKKSDFNLSEEVNSAQKIQLLNSKRLIENISKEKIKANKNNQIKKDKDKKKDKIKKEDKNKKFKFNGVITNSEKIKFNYKFKFNDYEMNRLNYEEALEIDKRTFFQYYWSLLKTGHLFIFSFIPNNDYNIMIIKVCLFFFSFGLYFTVNALFYTDATMNKIYEEEGEYDFIYQIPKILSSNLICTVVNLIVKSLSLSEKDILKIKLFKKGENFDLKVEKIRKCLLIKFILFYCVSFIFLFIFWFYVSCFCAVYQNTQLYLLKDTSISFALSLLYPFGYYLVPGIFRIPALRSKKKNKNCLYKLSLLVQSI